MKKQLSLFPTREQTAVQTCTERNQKVTWVLTEDEAAFFVKMSETPLYQVMEGGGR